MNKTMPNSLELKKALADQLRDLLGRVKWLRGWRVELLDRKRDCGFDVSATLPSSEGGRVALCVVCKRECRPSAFLAFAGKPLSPPGRVSAAVPVLAAPVVSPRLAELCQERGWGWFDLAGNCLIDVPGVLYVERGGFPRVYAAPKPAANLGTPEAGRILRALLAPENAGTRWTQRSLQSHFENLPRPIPNPSLGLVNKVIRHLRDEAFLEDASGGGFRVSDPVRLLFAWREAYRFDRHVRRRCFTLKKGQALRDALAEFEAAAGPRAAYAAFSAAELQAPHVRQPKTWVYVAASVVEKFLRRLEAKEVDSGENLIVLIPNDEGVFYLCDRPRRGRARLPATNPVQTYVDLWRSGGRGEEAAEALLEQVLAPAWRLRGSRL